MQVMLSYVDILLLTQDDASKALAATLNSQVQTILSNDAAAVRDIETQVCNAPGEGQDTVRLL